MIRIKKINKIPYIFSGNYKIGVLHGDYIALDDINDVEYTSDELIEIALIVKQYLNKK